MALMNLLDRSVAMTYQRSRDQLIGSHWCEAWTGVIIEDPTPSIQNLPSRSHEPKVLGVSKRGNFGIPIARPVDLLSFAAYHGLHCYVEYLLDSPVGRRSLNIADYLLGCVVAGWEGRYQPSHLQLISALLKRGVNPDMESLEGTVWGGFLERMYDACIHGRHPELNQGLKTTAQDFLESGANVNEEVFHDVYIYRSDEATNVASSTLLRLTQCVVRLRLSTLLILYRGLAKDPEFSKIEDICTSSGATLDSECTHMFLNVKDEEGRERWLDSNLSEQQQSQLVDLDAWNEPSEIREAPSNSADIFGLRQCELQELFQELEMEKLYKEARMEEENRVNNDDGDDDDSENDWKTVPEEPSISLSKPSTPEAEGPSHSSQSSQFEN